MAAVAFEENFLHRGKEVAVRLTQLAHRPTRMHEGAIGQASVVNARNEIGHMVCMCWGGYGSTGEGIDEGLRGYWR